MTISVGAGRHLSVGRRELYRDSTRERKGDFRLAERFVLRVQGADREALELPETARAQGEASVRFLDFHPRPIPTLDDESRLAWRPERVRERPWAGPTPKAARP